MPIDNAGLIMSAITLGLVFGFVIQKGRFCLNSSFRDIIFFPNLEFFRAYLLCLIVAIIGTNVLESSGLIMTFDPDAGRFVSTQLMRQSFVPVANILGGFLFGLGIVLAGGCASGILYRLGEGQFAALIAMVGFFTGVGITTYGMFSPVREYLAGFKVDVLGVQNPAIWDLFGGGSVTKWGTITVFCVILLVFVLKGKPSFSKVGKSYSWGISGMLVGFLIIIAWEVSSFFGGTPKGLVITTHPTGLFNAILTNSAHFPFQEFSFLGIFTGTWGVFFILSVPLGAWISAAAHKEFKWKVLPVQELFSVFVGGIIMGIGAAIAGGCSIGHGLIGMSTMSLASLVAIMAIILGNWTMVYFKFIRASE